MRFLCTVQKFDASYNNDTTLLNMFMHNLMDYILEQDRFHCT